MDGVDEAFPHVTAFRLASAKLPLLDDVTCTAWSEGMAVKSERIERQRILAELQTT
jgi:hypothetical protein